MTASFPNTMVLLVGEALHAHAVARIQSTFRTVRIPRGDPALVTPALAVQVRGVAAAMTELNAAFIDALPELEIIAYYGMGYEVVDAAYAARRGVMVTNTPDVMNEEVADTALGLLLATLREFREAEAWLRDGRWAREGAYRLTLGTLRGRKAGIFGMGRIGSAIARRLDAFGVPVAYYNRRPAAGSPYMCHGSLLELARAVDTLICVAPGGPSTEKAVDQAVLEALGPQGVVINVGRGSVIDETALARSLADGVILAAGLDVFADEPHVPQALLNAPNATLLPHIASATAHTRRAVADLCVNNLVAWFGEGRPLTPVAETAGRVRQPSAGCSAAQRGA
jgi:lactate dehydrogenase-like 2-hydroxyacid dehydrogenase